MRLRIFPDGTREVIADGHEALPAQFAHLMPPKAPPGLLESVANALMSTITLSLLVAAMLGIATVSWHFLNWLEPPREIKTGALVVLGLACCSWALPKMGRRRSW